MGSNGSDTGFVPADVTVQFSVCLALEDQRNWKYLSVQCTPISDKNNAVLEGPYATVKMSVEFLWNGTDRGKLKYWGFSEDSVRTV